MAIITEVRFAHEDGALSHTLGRLSEIDVKVVRETSTDPRMHHCYLQVENGRRERVRAVFDEDHTVQDASPLPKFADQQVWVVTFDPETKLLAPRVTANDGLVIDARSSSPDHRPRGWNERWLLPDEEAIHDIWQHARDEGFSFELLTVHPGAHLEATNLGRQAPTDQQRRALALAYERGYFAEPRETSLKSLGEELDLSASAVGGRLKRGIKSVIGATLAANPPPASAPGDDGDRRSTDGSDRATADPPSGRAHDRPTSVAATLLRDGPSDGTTPDRGITLHVYVEHPRLALSPTIRALQSVDIGVVSDAGTDPDHVAYFFWVETDEFDEVEAAFDDDPTVASYTPIARGEDRRTYRIQYTDEARLITPKIGDLGAIVADSRSHSNGWLLSLQLQDNESLHRLNEFFDRTTFQHEVFELHRGESQRERIPFDLTESQAAALVRAYDEGYYDDPREISLEELGTILGRSQTAVSGRLRRGCARLLEEVLDP